jgi:hypothetical protein
MFERGFQNHLLLFDYWLWLRLLLLNSVGPVLEHDPPSNLFSISISKGSFPWEEIQEHNNPLSFHYQLILFALLLTFTCWFLEDNFLFQLDMFPSLSAPILKIRPLLQESSQYSHSLMSHCLSEMIKRLRHLKVVALNKI